MSLPKTLIKATPFRLVVAVALSFTLGIAFAHSIGVDERFRGYAAAREASNASFERLAVAAFGDIYLSEQKPIGPVVSAIIRLGDRLAPSVPGSTYDGIASRPRGALSWLRDFLTTLGIMLLVPFTIISVGHLILTKRGSIARDEGLGRILIHMLTVALLLHYHPWWDTVLYRGLSIPLTDMFRKGTVIDDAIKDITKVPSEVTPGEWLTLGEPGNDYIPTDDNNDAMTRLARGPNLGRLA